MYKSSPRIKFFSFLVVTLIYSVLSSPFSPKLVHATSSSVIINEIRSNSSDTTAPNLATGEWIELYVAADTNLTGWALSDQDGSNKGGACGAASGDFVDCNYFFPQVGGSDCDLTTGSYVVVLTGAAPGTGTGWLPHPPGTAPAGDVCNPGGTSYFFIGNTGSSLIWNNPGDDVVLYQPTSQLDSGHAFKSCMTGMQDGSGSASSLEPYIVIDYVAYGSGSVIDLPPGAGGTHGTSGTCPTINWANNPSAPTSSQTLSLNPNGVDTDDGDDWQISNGTTTVNDIVDATSVPGYDGGGSPGWNNNDFAFTPVTLSYFETKNTTEGVEFVWQTATELSNMGFNLYVEIADGLQQINDSLILSQEMSSLEALDYSFNADVDVKGDSFYIEDIDIFGHAKRHGPFALGQAYGRKAEQIPVDWAAIQAEHDAKSRGAEKVEGSGVVGGTDPLITVGVSQDGLYRLTHADLLAAGVDLRGSNLSDIALTQGGLPRPITVNGRDGLFDVTSRILFYGQAIDTLYSKENVYVLHLDARLAVRTTEDSSRPSGLPALSYQETIHLGDDNKYDTAMPGNSPWYDTRFVAQMAPSIKSYTFDVDNYAGSGASILNVDLIGITDWSQNPDHHVVVDFGGATVADVQFDGLMAYPVEVKLPAATLQNGVNTLQITVPVPSDATQLWDVVNLDTYRLTYPRNFVAKADGQLTFNGRGKAFQVDGLPSADVLVYRYDHDGSLTRLTNVAVSGTAGNFSAVFAGRGREATYLVYSAESLLTPTLKAQRPYHEISIGPVDYLMISHADFINDLAPLVAFHESNGRHVQVVDVADVYQQYGDGTVNPQAIKDYLQYAAANMGVEFVLLVGGDTYDYFDNLGLGSISFIPSPYMRTGHYVNFAPVDPLYADVDGDFAPDLKLGRFPVRTTAELQDMIDKTLTYAVADYKETAVFSADSQAERSFTEISNRFASLLPDNWQINTAYLDEDTLVTAQNTLIDSINGGVGLTSFVGHSGSDRWTFQGLFDATAAGNLSNVGLPTAVAQWGCWNTYHVNPRYNTLGQQFMLGNNGAAVVLGASTLTDADNDSLLGEAFMTHLAQGTTSFGEALQLAKADVESNSPGLLDVQLGFTLLGDPALSLANTSCAPAPTPTNVTIVENNGDHLLRWDDLGVDVAHYEVWHSIDDNFYFTPTGDCATSAACTIVDGIELNLGNIVLNQSYLVLAVNHCGGRSPVTTAKRVGSFNFVLAPGMP